MDFIDKNTVVAYIVIAMSYNIIVQIMADINQYWKFDDNIISLDNLG
jgi:hypothetical protein